MKKLDHIIASTGNLDPPRDHRGPPLSRIEWERAVGPRVAARTEPYRLERGVLFVRAATAAWANELSMLAEPIIGQLRTRGFEVDTVRFNVGRVKPPEPPRGTAATPLPARVPELPAAIAELAAKIELPELRNAVARAAALRLAQLDRRSAEPATNGATAPAVTTSRAPARAAADRAVESPTPPRVSPPPPASLTRPRRAAEDEAEE